MDFLALINQRLRCLKIALFQRFDVCAPLRRMHRFSRNVCECQRANLIPRLGFKLKRSVHDSTAFLADMKDRA